MFNTVFHPFILIRRMTCVKIEIVGTVLIVLNVIRRPGGEIGRRTGFKLLYPSGCVGSTPTWATAE